MTTKPKLIEITPDRNTDITSVSQGVKNRLTDVENQTKAIYWVGVISLVGVIIASFALVIDQMHFNNQTYRDQSNISNAKFQELTTRIDLLDQQLKEKVKTQ